MVGVAFSKTDALQVALFLHEVPGWVTLLAIGRATAGVILLWLPQRAAAGAHAHKWSSLAAPYGLGSGAGFALSTVGYRGAALQLPDVSPWQAGLALLALSLVVLCTRI